MANAYNRSTHKQIKRWAKIVKLWMIIQAYPTNLLNKI